MSDEDLFSAGMSPDGVRFVRPLADRLDPSGALMLYIHHSTNHVGAPSPFHTRHWLEQTAKTIGIAVENFSDSETEISEA